MASLGCSCCTIRSNLANCALYLVPSIVLSSDRGAANPAPRRGHGKPPGQSQGAQETREHDEANMPHVTPLPGEMVVQWWPILYLHQKMGRAWSENISGSLALSHGAEAILLSPETVRQPDGPSYEGLLFLKFPFANYSLNILWGCSHLLNNKGSKQSMTKKEFLPIPGHSGWSHPASSRKLCPP